MKPEFGKLKDTGMCPHGNFKDSCAACADEQELSANRQKVSKDVEEASAQQNAERPLWKKIIRKDKVGSMDVLYDKAKEDDKRIQGVLAEEKTETATEAIEHLEAKDEAKENLISIAKTGNFDLYSFIRDERAKDGLIDAKEANNLEEVQTAVKEGLISIAKTGNFDLYSFIRDERAKDGLIDAKEADNWPEIIELKKMANDSVDARKKEESEDLENAREKLKNIK